MLTQAQVQRYAVESGLWDIMIAEKEVVLTFLLQLFSERGLLDRLAFKGGTCLPKMHLGGQGPLLDRPRFQSRLHTRMESGRFERGEAANQPEGNSDPCNGDAASSRTELFPLLAVCSIKHSVPCTA